MTDAEKNAKETVDTMTPAQKKEKLDETRNHLDYSKPFYGHNSYWAALFEYLDQEFRP